jgi:DNA polymerase-3 subunit delta'
LLIVLVVWYLNFDGFDFDESTQRALGSLESNGRIPHAIIIESSDTEKASEAARFLSMYAVCEAEQKPCSVCSHCHKAAQKAHADISYLTPLNKSKTYAIGQVRDMSTDAYIKPNEANAKVFVLEYVDEKLSTTVQNSFLKLLEEPPQNVYFIMTCENSRKLLVTILSRCTLVRLSSNHQFGEAVLENAKSIVNGILSTREYDLLLAVNVLCDKENSADTLAAVRLILRDGLALLSGGKPELDEHLGRQLCTHFTRGRLIEMIELTESADKKITENVNINLLTTWLCGEYRRISWQR